jgi:hypothetical protein
MQKGEVSDEAKSGAQSWLPWLLGDHPMQTGRRDLRLAGRIVPWRAFPDLALGPRDLRHRNLWREGPFDR